MRHYWKLVVLAMFCVNVTSAAPNRLSGQDKTTDDAQRFLAEALPKLQKNFSNCCFDALSRSLPLEGFPKDGLLGSYHYHVGWRGPDFLFINTLLDLDKGITESEWNIWLQDAVFQVRDVREKSITISNEKYSARLKFKEEKPFVVEMGPPTLERFVGSFQFLVPNFDELKEKAQFRFKDIQETIIEGRPAKIVVIEFQDTDDWSPTKSSIATQSFYFDVPTSYILRTVFEIDEKPAVQVDIDYDWTKTPVFPTMLRRVSHFSHFEQVVAFKNFRENCLDSKECFLSFYGLPEPPGETANFEVKWIYVFLAAGVAMVVLGTFLRYRKRST